MSRSPTAATGDMGAVGGRGASCEIVADQLMDRFRRILVVASPSRAMLEVLRAAVNLATTNQTRVTVLDMASPSPRRLRRVRAEDEVIDVGALPIGSPGETLREMLMEEGRHDTDLIVTSGDSFRNVIQHAIAHRNDLVMMGEPFQSDGPTTDLSDRALHVLRKCPVPVWLVRPMRTSGVLALVDPDPSNPGRDSLNHAVMNLAISLARSGRAALHVGHAWSVEGESILRWSPYTGAPDPFVDRMAATREQEHRDRLDALVARHIANDQDVSIHMLSGEPHEVLPHLARRLAIGLVVMGTMARTGLRSLAVGNTAETILQTVNASVVALKPGGSASQKRIRLSHPR